MVKKIQSCNRNDSSCSISTTRAQLSAQRTKNNSDITGHFSSSPKTQTDSIGSFDTEAQIVVCNPCQSFPILIAITVPLSFVISIVFL